MLQVNPIQFISFSMRAVYPGYVGTFWSQD